MRLLIFVLMLAIEVYEINCHARLLVPPARSSAWREDPSKFPPNYTDNEMSCGGIGTQWNQNGGKCGICGEDYSKPKNYEKGGWLYRGYVVRTYSAGSRIDVVVEVTSNHLGFFEFKLCNVDGLSSDATQECLDRTYLINEVSMTTKYTLPAATWGKITIPIRLPSGFSCNQCVFQWRYHTANNWNIDPLTNQGCLGCGPQEEFYGCADIKIEGSGGSSYYVAPAQNVQATTTLSPAQPVTTATTKTTKPIIPILNPTTVASTNKCYKGDGYYADVSSGCQKFYQCVFSGTSYQLISYLTCPTGTIFDAKLNVCNWPSQVTCA